jgi:hypothetical protein
MGSLAFVVGNKTLMLTPAQARAQNIPFQVLSDKHALTLHHVAELTLPGSTVAGVVHFIDQQLSRPADECLLMIRYLGIEAPYREFYLSALVGFEASAQQMFGANFHALERTQAQELFNQATRGDPSGWQGPPAPFFLFVLRADASDVLYGTQAGSEALSIPYMAHIEPSTNW